MNNEPTIKSVFNGNAQLYMRIASLAFQGLIVSGVFWVGATFVRKADFEAYKAQEEVKRVEELREFSKVSEIMGRLDERLKQRERGSP